MVIERMLEQFRQPLRFITRLSPDRRVLKREILPRIADRACDVLWIGCRAYTREYPRLLEAKGARCWSLDIDPTAARFGHPLRHIVGDLLHLEDHFGPGAFDAILCNGVLGFGVDSTDAQTRAFSQMALSLRRGGSLILGWNTNKISDPIDLFPPNFAPADLFGLGKRLAVVGCTHVYDFLEKTKHLSDAID
jgi:SAM-dependent methyltransferase